MTFDPKFEPVLDALDAKLAADDAEKVKALASHLGTSLKAHVEAVDECITIGIIFLNGFKQISAKGPLRSNVSEAVRNWVDTVSKKQSGIRIAGMIASSICSVLEGFIADLGPAKLTATRLATIRMAKPQLDADDQKARAKLLKSVKPSVNAKGTTWIACLGDVFSVSLTAEEQDTLVDLITFRNEYVHDPPTAFSNNITGEHLKCWAVAVMILCRRIAVS